MVQKPYVLVSLKQSLYIEALKHEGEKMVKGFVFFRDGKIPFVIEDYCIELFSDDCLLKDFMKEYNFKKNYILQGEYFGSGFQAQKVKFLVEHSIGSTCYLCCYIICGLTAEDRYDTIGFQSSFLDDVFRYKYTYLNIVRDHWQIENSLHRC